MASQASLNGIHFRHSLVHECKGAPLRGNASTTCRGPGTSDKSPVLLSDVRYYISGTDTKCLLTLLVPMMLENPSIFLGLLEFCANRVFTQPQLNPFAHPSVPYQSDCLK